MIILFWQLGLKQSCEHLANTAVIVSEWLKQSCKHLANTAVNVSEWKSKVYVKFAAYVNWG